MTPKNLLIALISLFAIDLHAADFGLVYPGRPGPGPGRPGPVRPVPPRPAPPRPVPQPQIVTRTIFLNRIVTNEILPLRQLAGIGSEFNGFRLESVRLDVLGGINGSTAQLVVNNQVEAGVVNPLGSIYLAPRTSREIGYDLQGLALRVNGSLNMRQIDITLRGSFDRPDRPGEDLLVPVPVQRRLIGNDRLEIGDYVNLDTYRGYRLVSLEVEAESLTNNSLVDVLLNSDLLASFAVNRQVSRAIVPGNRIELGFGDSLVLMTRGDLLIRNVTLRLSRY